jgi:DNA repair exonuclease SbcCD ATPase subunit
MTLLHDRRAILAEYAKLGIKPISGGEAKEGETKPATEEKIEPKTEPKGETGGLSQEEINRLVGAAREEGRKAERDRLEAERQEAERRKKQEDEAKAGNFQKVIDDLTVERDDLKAELETAQAELAKWREKAGKEIDEKVAEIKKVNPALAELDPGGDDIFKRSDWLGKAMKVVGDLTKDGKSTGNGPNPKVGSGVPSADETYKQMAAARGIRVR